MRVTLGSMQSRGVIWTVSLLLSFLLGCSAQAPYMQGWVSVERLPGRWTGGTFKESKLSEDEQAVYAELGAPEVIRFFRSRHTRQKVYEWIYLEQDDVVWFVEGRRVDYIAVDTKNTRLTKETRETVEHKLIAGGVLGALVGGIAAGTMLFGDSLGLKD